MTQKLHISAELSLPMEAVTQTFGILAKRGVGKSYTGMVMTEEMLKAEQQVVVCDPIGVWWGLRSSADGKSAGLPIVVFGGEHGDVPLDENAGEVVATAIIEHGFSAVLDVSVLRKGPAERDALMASLPSLPIGTAWFWSPGWLDVFKRVKIRERETFDSSATPKIGQRKATPKVLAAIDLAKLGDQIKASAERARENDPKHLRAEISRLKKELEKSERPGGPLPAPPEIREVPVLDEKALTCFNGMQSRIDEARESIEDLNHQLVTTQKLIHEAITKAAGASQRAKASLQAGRKSGQVLHRDHVPSVRPVPRAAQPGRGAEASSGGDSGSVSGGLRRMMVALAQRPDGLTKKQLGVRAGLSSSSGTFGTYLGRFRANGWVEGSDVLRLTDAGFKALDDYEPLPTGADLLRYWLGELGGGAARMLAALAEAYPQSMSDETLGEMTWLSAGSGTFGTYLGKLRTLELIEGPRSALRASEELFV